MSGILAHRSSTSMDGPMLAASPYYKLKEPPLSTRKQAKKMTPRLIKSTGRRPQQRSGRVLEMLVMKYPYARPVSCNVTDFLLDDSYVPSTTVSYLEQVYERLGTLGDGSFGVVYHIRHRITGEEFAVKCLTDPYKGNNDRREKIREVYLHQKAMKHENVLQMKMAWEEWDRLYMVTELCSSTMTSLMEKEVPEPLAWTALIDMAHALESLQQNRIIHNDIKPENIFVDKNGVFKIGDFGMAIDLETETLEIGLREGDSQYLATEVLADGPSFASDIFSLGLTIFQFATDLLLPKGGTERWHELRNLEIDDSITNIISKDLKDILLRMMDPEPTVRFTVEELLNRPELTSRMQSRLHRFLIRLQTKLSNVAQKLGLIAGTSSERPEDEPCSSDRTPPQTLASPPLPDPRFSRDFNRNIDDDDDFMTELSPGDRARMNQIKREYELSHGIHTPLRSAKSVGLRSPKSLRKRLASMRMTLDERLSAMDSEEPTKQDHQPPVLKF
ncbi:unnamed protein product [Bursaphelenchus okinawaensis]|uniref:non-specific serine/threonine protein kinase n=1 Tax=Bursaphelenchus okinawaensis TaxID=465554 RepID=A0A811KVN4_9BILA|nr:unnamed protein product [Bursaphelenchus okinawaensis]CAG9112148.1 unnamed protein product [Bursaphelenchus okinawaensis]